MVGERRPPGELSYIRPLEAPPYAGTWNGRANGAAIELQQDEDQTTIKVCMRRDLPPGKKMH